MLVYSHFYSISGTKFLRLEINKASPSNYLTELSLSNLMKIVIESPEKLTDSDMEEIVDVWNRKGRWIAV